MRPCVPWFVVQTDVFRPHQRSGETVPNSPAAFRHSLPAHAVPVPRGTVTQVLLNSGATWLLQNSVLRRHPTPQAYGPQGTGVTGCRVPSFHVLLPLSHRHCDSRAQSKGGALPSEGLGGCTLCASLRQALPGGSGRRK